MFSLDNSIKYISLGGFLMIFLSSLKLTVYYSFFDINIGEYVQLNEYVVQFIYDLYYYILMFAAGIIFNIINIFSEKKYSIKEIQQDLIDELKKKKEKAIGKEKQDLIDDIEYYKKKNQPEKVNIKLGIIFGSLILIGIIITIFYPELRLSKRYGIFCVIFILGITFLFLLLSRTKYEIKPLYYLPSILLATMVGSSIVEAQEIKENNSRTEVNLIYDNGDKVETSPIRKYVGKTEKYVFFYDLETTKTEIFSLEGVNKIEIKKD